MQAARIVKLNEPLQIQDLQTPKPRGSQILIKIQSVGVCHSDVHVWEGYYEGIDGQQLKTTDRGVKYPLTPGHEIAGVVDDFGEESEGFNKNDKVLVYPWIGDGVCPACRMGEENLCDKPRLLGVYVDGGYAEYVFVPSYRYLVKIGNDMDMDTTAPLSCAGLTAYGAVKNAPRRYRFRTWVFKNPIVRILPITLSMNLYPVRVVILRTIQLELQHNGNLLFTLQRSKHRTYLQPLDPSQMGVESVLSYLELNCNSVLRFSL